MVPGLLVAGGLHGLAPLGDQPDALVEGQGAGGHEGGVLAEAVAGADRGLDAEALDRVEHHQAGTKVESWALRVSFSSSASASSRRWATSRPATSEASSTSSQDWWSTQGRPMPGFWEPWPGNVKASMW